MKLIVWTAVVCLGLWGLVACAGETARASHILVKEEKRARALQAELSALDGDELAVKFAEYAKVESSCPSKSKGGDLGTFRPGAMVKPFDEAVFQGKVGDVSYVETDFGHHVVWVTEKSGGVDSEL